MNRDQSAIGRLLRKNNFITNNYISKETSIKISNLYQEGKSLNDISKLLSLSPITIYKHCLKHNIKMRPVGSKLHIANKNFFETINSDSAYMLGLFVADGSLSSNKHKICLSLNKRDIYIVEKFKELLGAEHKICHSKDMRSITIQDKYIFNCITKYGIPGDRKTYNINKCDKLFQTLKETGFAKDFIRGFLDGDGSIYLHKTYFHHISFVGFSKEFLESINKCIMNNTNITTGYFHKRKNGNTYTLSYSGGKRIRKILSWIYYENMSIYMTRKFEKALKILNQFNN